MENPTARIVKRYLDADPILREYLAEGLINCSALVRKLLPKARRENPKASPESILIAIQRSIPKRPIARAKLITSILSTTEVSLTGDIIEIVFDRTEKNEGLLLERMKRRKGTGICILTETRQEIALFISRHFLPLFKDVISKVIIEDDLAVLGLHETTISRSKSSQYIPGYLAHLCLLFAQNDISIIELVSCHSHILIFMKENNASKAYGVLKEHIREI